MKLRDIKKQCGKRKIGEEANFEGIASICEGVSRYGGLRQSDVDPIIFYSFFILIV